MSSIEKTPSRGICECSFGERFDPDPNLKIDEMITMCSDLLSTAKAGRF
jgi:hypothetical protein